MPFIPHTENDVREMLEVIGVSSIDQLFDEIPKSLQSQLTEKIPTGVNEQSISRIMRERARLDGEPQCFIGAGAYQHHIPAAVWELTTRGEFYTAYTPYQAEASQGTLQLLYEYQTMMAGLTGLDVSNASLYDGASALAEAVLMAIRANKSNKSKRILIPRTVHPNYRDTVRSIVTNQQIEISELPFSMQTGCLDLDVLEQENEDFAALVIAQPNFFGQLEDIDVLCDWAHSRNALVIAVCNPMTLAVLKPPAQWGQSGADIACGEGQPLGVPLASGGPYYGYLCCKQSHVRQMPGRLVGRTVDSDNNPGYTLTLQAREQHIRRSRATSNICTNQGLVVTASTIYMSLMGAKGLAGVASSSYANTHRLFEKLAQIAGVNIPFSGDYFHENVIQLDVETGPLLRAMSAQNILAGYPLEKDYPELGNSLLVCVTETKSEQDLANYVENFTRIMSKQATIKCPIQPKT